jgi:hypothetical protein
MTINPFGILLFIIGVIFIFLHRIISDVTVDTQRYAFSNEDNPEKNDLFVWEVRSGRAMNIIVGLILSLVGILVIVSHISDIYVIVTGTFFLLTGLYLIVFAKKRHRQLADRIQSNAYDVQSRFSMLLFGFMLAISGILITFGII